MTQAEFDSLLADSTKRIEQDIAWQEDEDRSPGVEFRAQVISDPGFPIFMGLLHIEWVKRGQEEL
jgi:hypothetical protein